MARPAPFDDERPSAAGPCPCGSALPPSLCCLARDALAGDRRQATFSQTDAQDATAVAQWDLVLTTVQALAEVLPDVPVPLLGNLTPRDLYAAGADQRAAVLGYLESVAQTAEAVSVSFPLADLRRALGKPPPSAPCAEARRQIALAAFTLQMLARGFQPKQVLGAHRLFRDAVRALEPALRRPLGYAAAVDYAACWIHFRPEGRDEIATLYAVSPATVSRHFAEMKQGLKLVWYDPRYAVQDAAWQEMLEETARALADGEPEPPAPPESWRA